MEVTKQEIAKNFGVTPSSTSSVTGAIALSAFTAMCTMLPTGEAVSSVYSIEPHLDELADTPKETMSAQSEHAIKSFIEQIRDGLAFNVSEVAKALGVTRPTIYSWMKGNAPQDSTKAERLKRLAMLADHWKALSGGRNMSYIYDYKGVSGSETSVREALAGSLSIEESQAIFAARHAEFSETATANKAKLRKPPEIRRKALPKTTRTMNESWAASTKVMHQANQEPS